MSHTKRFCNKHNKKLTRLYHQYKLNRSRCRCDYCIDDHAEKHRREKIKVYIERELRNLCPYYDITGENECFGCIMVFGGEDCKYAHESLVISFKRMYSIK